MDGSDKKSSRPKSRQSIAHMPSLARTQDIDRQNATIDLSAARSALLQNGETSKKRTRGKSLGPGGLEALRETEGNTIKTVSMLQPKSILKPTVPLTPPKSIPSFDELRQRSTRKKSPGKTNTEALLIDFSTPGPSRDVAPYTSTASSQNLLDPFSPVKAADATGNHENGTLQAVDEEERLRQERKKTILEQRAARRKSMANRRVSFAPEATLHTWSVMELMEDSTTSSASNSTRRQSSMTAQQTPQRNADSVKPDAITSDPPSTPPRPSESPLVEASPAHQKDLHQKRRRRRSSNMSDDMKTSAADDVYSSSPSGDITTESSPIRVEDSIDSESDTDGDTAMSMDEVTQNTINSPGSASSTQSSLEERLREAANQAGTKGIEYDEYGDDMSMEIADETVTNAFQPWNRNQQRQEHNEDQENFNPFSPAKKAQQISTVLEHDNDTTQGMTMEMTKAIGGIIGDGKSPQKSRRKSMLSRRRSSVSRRQSTTADSSYGDETMDFTTMAGGILSANGQDESGNEDGSDEDVTMEFTTAIGGVQSHTRGEPTHSMLSDETETMDMTAAVGGVLAPIEEQTEPQTDNEDDKTVTMAMEMTKAVGQILSRAKEADGQNAVARENATPAKEDTLNVGSPFQAVEDTMKSTPRQLTSVASETGSPSLAVKTRASGRRSARVSQASTPKSAEKGTPSKVSSIKKQSTPTKQLTPVPTRAKTPERTPISAHVTHRGSSPKKLFQAEIAAKASPASLKKSTSKQQNPLFAQDELTGRQTPRVVLQAPKPRQNLRRSSGIGIDKEGFGSPSVTQLLSRRSSIGDAAPVFKLEPSQTPRLRFEDPKQIADELDAERAEDERRESGRFVMEQEANEQQEENVTQQLKDMIESLSPKKHKVNKLKGRKSLAVGSAKGLLGKRPMELDEEDEQSSTPKRLRAVSREGSPVKKIHLPNPPTKEETTGRLSKAEQKLLDASLNGNLTPSSNQYLTQVSTSGSPQPQSRYRNIGQNVSEERPTTFEDKLDNVLCAVDANIVHPIGEANGDGEKISLQQFLNMTNIHFIELDTTKRRHTMAQITPNEMVSDAKGQTNSMKDHFVAAATTMPLLELYQHATKELKSYISTGRKIIRSIESETFAEQPALFREYIEARPDVKLVMDNQFRNGKTNARLQSKEGWYMWRSQLVDGLKNGLEGIQGDIEKDLTIVEAQAQALEIAVPKLTAQHDALANEAASLQQRLDIMDSEDYLALKASRQELQSVDLELQEKLSMLEALQNHLQEKDDALSQAAELKEEMEQQITEANKFREEHQGWNAKDVIALRSKVDMTQKQSGWSLVSAEEDSESPDDFGIALTMNYQNSLRLFFYPSVYSKAATSGRRRSNRGCHSASGSTAPISLTYLSLNEDDTPPPQLPTEKRFVLQLLQGQLQAFSMLPRGSIHVKTVLDTVSSGWDMACKMSEEVRLLNLAGITRVSIQSDEELNVKLMLMVANMSRVDIDFKLGISFADNSEISVLKSASASAVYGPVAKILNGSKTRKVQSALTKEVESQTLGEGAWINAVQAFEEWHRSQPQLQQRPVSQPVDRPERSEAAVDVAPIGSTTPKSPVPNTSKTPTVRRSPLAAKKSSIVQKKIPVPTSRQDKFRTSQREQQPQVQLEKSQIVTQEFAKEKENLDPFVYSANHKAPAIPPEMQEAMMQRTPIKRVGALRRSPI